MAKKIVYTEPTDYIPKDVRKELKLGEYAEADKEKEQRAKENADLRKAFKGK